MISSGRKMLLSASVWHLSRGSTASLMLLCDQTVDRRARVALIAGSIVSSAVSLPHKKERH